MSIDHHDRALAHVDAVKAARQGLRNAYREPVHSPQVVARLNAELGDALKLAEIEATLYIGDRLDALVRSVDAQRLTPDEVDNLLRNADVA